MDDTYERYCTFHYCTQFKLDILLLYCMSPTKKKKQLYFIKDGFPVLTEAWLPTQISCLLQPWSYSSGSCLQFVADWWPTAQASMNSCTFKRRSPLLLHVTPISPHVTCSKICSPPCDSHTELRPLARLVHFLWMNALSSAQALREQIEHFCWKWKSVEN